MINENCCYIIYNISGATVVRRKQNHLTLNIKGCVAVNDFMCNIIFLRIHKMLLVFCRKRALRRVKSCWRLSSAACWPATVNPFPRSSSWTPSVWTRSWRFRRTLCSNTCRKPCSKTSSALLAGWWSTDVTRVRLYINVYTSCCSALLQSFVSRSSHTEKWDCSRLVCISITIYHCHYQGSRRGEKND